MSKVHGGLQRPRALPVGRRERDLQREPAAGRRLWRLFAPAGGALRHRDHAAVPEGIQWAGSTSWRGPGSARGTCGATSRMRPRGPRARCRRTSSARRARVFVLASAGVSVRLTGARRAFRLRAGAQRRGRRARTARRRNRLAARRRGRRRDGCAPSRAPSVPAGVPSGSPRSRRPARRATPVPTPSLGGGGGGAPPRPEDDAPPASPARRVGRREPDSGPSSRFAGVADDDAHAAATAPPSRTRRRPGRRRGPAAAPRRVRRHRRLRRGPRRAAVARLVKPAVAGEAGAIALDSTLDDDEADDEGARTRRRGPGGPALARVLHRRARPQLLLPSSRARAAGGRRPRPTCRTHPAERIAGPPTLPGPAIARLSAPLSWRHPEASCGVGPRVVVIERAVGTGVSLLSIAALACFCAVAYPGKRVAPASSTQPPRRRQVFALFGGALDAASAGVHTLSKEASSWRLNSKELRGHAIAAEPRSSKPCPRPSRGRRTARATCCARRRFRELSANRRVS